MVMKELSYSVKSYVKGSSGCFFTAVLYIKDVGREA